MNTGNVFNIMKYSIHDGPGIRTTVFLKGCPLSCWWCHNPESQSFKQELFLRPDRCTGCGKCIEVCPHQALSLKNGIISINYDSCDGCGACATVCVTEALEVIGNGMSVREVLGEIEKDVIFYDESGGGVTFSGGEALAQPHFLKEVLNQCKEKEIHTALETTGYTRFEVLEGIAEAVDLFLYDLKLIDSNKHKTYTGVANEVILENLIKLSAIHPHIIVRIPIIPGINDDDYNIVETAKFIKTHTRVNEVHLLPYHHTGAEKYKRLGREYKLPDITPPPEEHMVKLAALIENLGLKTKIGG